MPRQILDHAHGANRVRGSVKKKGSNKGIAAMHKERRRKEANERAKARAKRSDADQADLLLNRPGYSLREMGRLGFKLNT